MNTQLTSKNLAVNTGTVQSSERPLWVGDSKVVDNVNGRYMKASVSRDRDWLWLRFSQKPSEEWRRKLISNGFVWSNVRKAWHVEVSTHIVAQLNDWGAYHLTYAQVAKAAEWPPVASVKGNLEIDEPSKIKTIATKPPKESKPKTSKSDDSNAQMMAMMQQMMALTQQVATLTAIIATNSMQQPQAQQPTQPDVSHRTNGNTHYGVAGMKLG